MKTAHKQTSLKEILKGVDMRVDTSVIHITPYNSKWKVRRAGTLRAIAIKQDKRTAISTAKKVNDVSRIVVHGKDGKFQKRIYL